jgi:thioredoxin reductase (NADPH)
MNELVIIGSGPAGLTAAIYAARARLNPILVAGLQYGGQLMNTTEVENYPGFPDGIKGPDLMQNMLTQAEKFGTKIIFENATKIEKAGDSFQITTDGEQKLDAKAVIISTGAIPRRLNIPGEDKFYGKGVSTCATCDGAFFRDKIIAVVGGGDSAMEEANFLTKFASKIYLIHRKSEFNASKIMQERVLNNPKIEVVFNTEVKEILGDKLVTGIKIFNNKDNTVGELRVDGFFLAIGHIPVTDFVKELLELNELGYIKTNDGVNTSVEGIFVGGDVEDHLYRQAITAAGAGCKAAIRAERWLHQAK